VKDVSVKISLFGIEQQNIGKLKDTIRKNEATIQRLEKFVETNQRRALQRAALFDNQVNSLDSAGGEPSLEREG